MGKKIESNTLHDLIRNLPNEPAAKFPDDFEPDTSDIPEIGPEEYNAMIRYTELNRALCGIIRAILKHNNLSLKEAKSKMGSLSPETIHLIMESEQVPVKNSLLLISISLLMMDRKIKIPGIVEKTLKTLSKSAA